MEASPSGPAMDLGTDVDGLSASQTSTLMDDLLANGTGKSRSPEKRKYVRKADAKKDSPVKRGKGKGKMGNQ